MAMPRPIARLLRGLAAMGQQVLFLERDVPWYAANRDLPHRISANWGFYDSLDDLRGRFGAADRRCRSGDRRILCA